MFDIIAGIVERRNCDRKSDGNNEDNKRDDKHENAYQIKNMSAANFIEAFNKYECKQ